MEDGYIKIVKYDLSKSDQISNIIDKIGSKLSQSVIDIYLKDFISYNILDKNQAKLIKIAVSDKSLDKVDILLRDNVRADIFKNLIINTLE